MQWERFAVVDVETTGFSPTRDRVVEVACVLVDGNRVGTTWATLIDPGIPIPARATEVHGIADADVAGAPSIGIGLSSLGALCKDRLLVAHNAEFDLAFLGWPSPAALCTVRLARALIPEAPNHKNQTLRRVLRLDRVLGDLAAHRALDDALVTAHVLMACRRRFARRYPEMSWPDFIRRVALIHAPLERAS